MNFDIAALEAEARAQSANREPFTVTGRTGKVYNLPHSEDMTLEQLEQAFSAAAENRPLEVLQVVLGDDVYDEFRGTLMPVLDKIVGSWFAWSGLANQGEAVASSRSSNGSARRSRSTSRTITRASA